MRAVLTYLGVPASSRARPKPYLLTPSKPRPLELPPPRDLGAVMVLACAEFVALPMPVGCDVPAGALNHTGVMSKRNELLLRSRATVSLAPQRRSL